MNKLLIVGTVAFDAIETPFGKTDKILGGAGTFIGLSASNFGVDSAVVSVVGGDFPESYMNLLKDKGVDVSGIEIVKEGKTFFWSGKYHNDMNSRDTLVTELNVLADFNPVVPANYKDAEVVMLGNLHPLVQLSVLEQMEKEPKLVVLDTMNFWMDNSLEDLKKVISRVNVITINDEEARQLSGEHSLVKAAKVILQMGPKHLIIKKGEHGALLFNHKNVFFTPALPLEDVLDPTGAGDSFAGGFIGYLEKTDDTSFENMKKAVVYASVMASFTVEEFGTKKLQELKKQHISSRIKNITELVDSGLIL